MAKYRMLRDRVVADPVHANDVLLVPLAASLEQLTLAHDAEYVRRVIAVGLAVCDAKEGKSKEALAKLQELIKSNDSTDQPLFARISNAMGLCYEALGQNDQAALAFLRTDLLFSSAPDLHAEALYHLAQLLPKVNEPQEGLDAKNRLKARYPASPWNNMK